MNKLAPLPLKDEPDVSDILPLTITLPVNCEPNKEDSTLNPKLGATDAVTLPLAIKVAVNAGIFVNLLPSPANEPLNEPLNSPPINLLAVTA